jgi:hypothetical protein
VLRREKWPTNRLAETGASTGVPCCGPRGHWRPLGRRYCAERMPRNCQDFCVRGDRWFRPRWAYRLYWVTNPPGKSLFLQTGVPWFGQGACSSVPTCHSRGDRAQAASNSPRSGGTAATHSPRLGASMARTHNLTPPSTAPGFRLVGACVVSAGPVDQASRVKRSAYRIANWFIASFQLCAALPQSAVILRNASQISLPAASSLGK